MAYAHYIQFFLLNFSVFFSIKIFTPVSFAFGDAPHCSLHIAMSVMQNSLSEVTNKFEKNTHFFLEQKIVTHSIIDLKSHPVEKYDDEPRIIIDFIETFR